MSVATSVAVCIAPLIVAITGLNLLIRQPGERAFGSARPVM